VSLQMRAGRSTVGPTVAAGGAAGEKEDDDVSLLKTNLVLASVSLVTPSRRGSTTDPLPTVFLPHSFVGKEKYTLFQINQVLLSMTVLNMGCYGIVWALNCLLGSFVHYIYDCFIFY
jgi:hypothetical protein